MIYFFDLRLLSVPSVLSTLLSTQNSCSGSVPWTRSIKVLERTVPSYLNRTLAIHACQKAQLAIILGHSDDGAESCLSTYHMLKRLGGLAQIELFNHAFYPVKLSKLNGLFAIQGMP